MKPECERAIARLEDWRRLGSEIGVDNSLEELPLGSYKVVVRSVDTQNESAVLERLGTPEQEASLHLYFGDCHCLASRPNKGYPRPAVRFARRCGQQITLAEQQ
jgi:hypothetical protein